MDPTSSTHRLSAILMAEVVGYARLTDQDQEGTLRRLEEFRRVFSGLIAKLRGHVVNAPGDAILAEFGSLPDAVGCAVEIQRELGEHNAKLPDDQRMRFRIGIAAAEEGARSEDGVRIAARVQSLAKPGEICISGTVLDRIKHELSLEYEHLGEKTVDQVADSAHVYRVLPKLKAAAPSMDRSQQGAAGLRRLLALFAAVGLIISVLAVTAWYLFQQMSPTPAPEAGAISPVLEGVLAVVGVLILGGAAIAAWNFYARTDHEPEDADSQKSLPLPQQPSIAVLPFVNLSEDEQQEYFSDGITEDIITDLGMLRGLFVIARNSTFTYKGKTVDARQVGRELGVRYVLEGSVRKAGDRVRISAQLVEATSGNHLWAKRYDRELKDIFALQDEITGDIVTELDVKLIEGEQAREWRNSTNDPEAYDYFLRGRAAHLRFTQEDNALGGQLLEKAIELDPEFTKAIVQLGWNYGVDAESAWGEFPSKSWERALELANRAIALDDTFGEAHSLLGLIQISHIGDTELGVAELEKAVALNPNSALSAALLGGYLGLRGKSGRALEMVKRAIRLNPFPPNWFYNALGNAYLFAGQYDEAITAFKECISRIPNFMPARVSLAVAYLETGNQQEARKQGREVLRINPQFTPENFMFAKSDPALGERMKILFDNLQ